MSDLTLDRFRRECERAYERGVRPVHVKNMLVEKFGVPSFVLLPEEKYEDCMTEVGKLRP
jgi:hypothetical protein